MTATVHILRDTSPTSRSANGMSGVCDFVLWLRSCNRRDVDAHDLAAKMLAQAAAGGQSACTVLSDDDADALHQKHSRLVSCRPDRLPPARMHTAVVVIRVDADVWSQDAAMTRAKLTPPV